MGIFALQPVGFQASAPPPQQTAGANIAPLALLGALVVVVMLLIWLLMHLRNRGHRKQTQYMVSHDLLTGLPNPQQLQAEMEKRGSCALAVFDIKYFKAYNELMGYDGGDVILKGVATQLRSLERQYSIFPAKLQSASFAMLLPAQPAPQLRQTVQQMLTALEAPGAAANWNLRFGCGVAYRQAGDAPQDVLQTANFARLAAAGTEDTEIVFFDSDTYHQLSRGIGETGQIRSNMGLGKLVVAYQPKYALDGCTLVGAEALIRWQHPQRGLLLPAEFLPILEQTGDIRNVDFYVLREVAWQLAQWREKALAVPPISVNLSRIQFASPTLTQELLDVSATQGVPPAQLALEMTEAAFATNEQQALGIVAQLRAAGFGITLDDFGKGAASINLLRKLAPSIVNLDRSLLHNLETDETQRLYVQDIVRLAHDMGIATLLKGVETDTQDAWAKELGCDMVQGFLYGRHMPPEDFTLLLQPGG